MPTYDYRCTGCRRTFTEVTTVADRDNMQGCPKCGCSATRQFTPTTQMYTRFKSDSQSLIRKADSLTREIKRRQHSQGYGPAVDAARASTKRKKPPVSTKVQLTPKQMAKEMKELRRKKTF